MIITPKKSLILLIFILVLSLFIDIRPFENYLPINVKNTLTALTPTVFPTGKKSKLNIPPSPIIVSATNSATVIKVIDGDTIVLENGERVRYIGIDAPETTAIEGHVECFSSESKQKNVDLVLHKTVTLEKDTNNTDRYGRLLRYVYVDDIFVNEILVREGYALSKYYRPDIHKQSIFEAAQREAEQKKSGLWKICFAP